MTEGELRMTDIGARGRAISIRVDGQETVAYEGESLAAALLAAGRRLTRWTARTGEARGYFCGMGVCQDCLVTADGAPNVRACMLPVHDGLRVETQRGLGDWGVIQ
jgi:predicted molibdopterin-dependent oxidoreductase YjgC